FNFSGPSMALDTMCASSLTTIHLACQSIRQDECTMALAGGVNVSIHPNKYLMLNRLKFSSSNGRCMAFGKGGDGFVPGEGVGAVLLRPLAHALAQGDHIYGVIKGSAINHSGKNRGYFVPNPNAQAAVIGRALEVSGIDPRTISYIEAHGTGTSLGDPIEIAGLEKAFRPYTQDNQFCAIGSVKSNIGHCEGAAGIAGITKVLLQLKYKTLVPSLHAKELNPHIDFAQSPFKVQQEACPWERPQISMDGKPRQFPRIAGISSFGAGGSNAHIIIEEYDPDNETVPDPKQMAPQEPVIIVLSAKSQVQLHQQARQLLAAISDPAFSKTRLKDVAWTLQTGRQAHGKRLGLIVKSFTDLEKQLTGYLESGAFPGVFQGQALGRPNAPEKKHDALITDKEAPRLLDLWVKGATLDWTRLYGKPFPRRVSLPTYPFEKKRYWVPDTETKIQNQTAEGPFVHPLVHENSSDLSGPRFTSIFTGKEFFLEDHVVNGQKIMPGPAFLEMARAAIERVSGPAAPGTRYLRLQDIAWLRPFGVDGQDKKLHMDLSAKEQIGFRIYSDPVSVEGSDPAADPGSEHLVVHCQGKARFCHFPPPVSLNLPDLMDQCSQFTLLPHHCYGVFKTMGMDYGPAHQCIETLYAGRDQVLAKLSLPTAFQTTGDKFFLHPGMMDAAFQGTMGLAFGNNVSSLDDPPKPAMAFALEEIHLFRKPPASLWAFIRPSHSALAPIISFDIDICDDRGNVCVRMKNFSTKQLALDTHRQHHYPEMDPALLPAAITAPAGDLLLMPVLEKLTPVDENSSEPFPLKTGKILVINPVHGFGEAVNDHYPHTSVLLIDPWDTIDTLSTKLENSGRTDHIFFTAPDEPVAGLSDETLLSHQEKGIFLLFKLMKALIALKLDEKNMGITLITFGTQAVGDQKTNPTHAAIHGFMGAAAKEYPGFKIQVLDLEPDSSWPIPQMFHCPPAADGNALVFRNNAWHQQRVIPLSCPEPALPVFKNQGVYLIIGGSGGIGIHLSEHLIRTVDAKIIWIGRRKLTPAIQGQMDRLKTMGTAPLYICADASDKTALAAALEEIKACYKSLDGIVHSAVGEMDTSLAKTDENRFRRILSAKVDTSFRIAQVFKEEPLDFVLFFSSICSFTKDSGKIGYAAGSTFMDAFALSPLFP
ncbi:MAG: SDR family NAD(P)-dependent oxidoreductase, partial [Spirochaetes bacterium]|nr:SDR family NAD(P)-dependent oxidoreductase [Spirochaetota bacterium]